MFLGHEVPVLDPQLKDHGSREANIPNSYCKLWIFDLSLKWQNTSLSHKKLGFSIEDDEDSPDQARGFRPGMVMNMGNDSFYEHEFSCVE